MATTELDLGRYKLGWSDPEQYVFKPRKGLNEDIVKEMSWMKGEPDWMTRFRLRALNLFERKPMLDWFAKNMPTIDFDDVYYYIKPTNKQVNDWDMLPDNVKNTYEKLGIPEAERKFLAGVTAQYESEVVYHKNRSELEEQGVLFTDMDTAIREWPELVRPYFGSIIPPNDNKFAAINSAVVEIIAKQGATVRYSTIQNWSPNVYNLVTKRAKAEAEASVSWVDGNLGSKLTMKYPAVYLTGPKAHGEVLSVAYAGEGQHQDAGAKMVHAAPETTSLIESKSISKDGGRTTYRGLVRVDPGCHGVKSHVRCDALILDEDSRSDTYPYMEIEEQDARIGHEATVSKVGEDQLFYLMSRGLSEQQATAMIVNGFIEPVVKTLPMEYAIELSRLIELSMEGSVG
jgi:Fe-S cluster assembly protein SufB